MLREPKHDCIYNNFKGRCRKMTYLYCRINNIECEHYITMDEALGRKRAEAAATATAQSNPTT